MNNRKVITMTALIVIVLASTLLIHLPLVHAYITVSHASFPPDLPGDVSSLTTGFPDNVVNMKDIAFVIAHCFSNFGDSKWDPRADVNDDGTINMRDEAIVNSLFNKHYNTSLVPIAYSTSFEFDAPAAGSSVIWYYILARVYVPSQLSNSSFYLDAQKSVDHSIRNVKVDNVMQFPNEAEGFFSIPLGQLLSGPHLLELEYIESTNAGLINFTVETSAHGLAWLDRCRICVPSYSSAMITYTVRTNTYFSGDDFFLGGHADKFIDNLWLGTKSLWPEWMWSTGSVSGGVGAIYGWGDGFMYPLGTPTGPYAVTFDFGNNMSGLLDFQFVSRSSQPDTIGPPKFYATAAISPGDGITVNSANIYGGSKWAGNPGVSSRNFTVLATCNASYNDQSGDWFNSVLDLGLGNWWATWELLANTPPDMGIPLNFTIANFTSDMSSLCEAYPPGTGYYWDVQLEDYKIDTYSFNALPIQGMECNQGQSTGIINRDQTIALDFIGTTIMTASAFMGPAAPIGACVGLGVTGLSIVLNYGQGQLVEQYAQTVQQNNHWQLTANNPMHLESYPVPSSSTDLIFIKTNPNSGYECGLTEVVLNGTMDALLYLSWPDNEYSDLPRIWHFPIGTITMTLCIPWFITSNS